MSTRERADALKSAVVVASPAHLRVKAGCAWSDLVAQARAAVPEAFSNEGTFLNLINGDWGTPGRGRTILSPVDGSVIGKLPMLSLPEAIKAVRAAAGEAKAWAKVDLDERRAKCSACLNLVRTHRNLLAGLLMWEIGKPINAANADVDRCIEGVAWYVDKAPEMLQGRKPLGLISNIASWNYPLSVLMHAVLVQVLAGNSAIAKAPSDGGGTAVALCCALARRVGLPVSFVSGSGSELSDALVRHDVVDCLSFVGGRGNGRDVAAALVDMRKRYMLEMEGVNAMGVWEYSDWNALSGFVRKGFDYAKQRCTAYPRFVVQRRLFPRFLEAYFNAVRSLSYGHPALVEHDSDPLPTLDFGPLINARKVDELRALVGEAIATGAIPIHEGETSTRFLPGQDTGAYMTPRTLLNVPRSAKLYFSEPFGPVDSIQLVDSVEELIAEMNISNGCLVSTLLTDDDSLAKSMQQEVRAFKFGHNKLRSRGDREELFGGLGQSWKGCFVGGDLLVRAVTRGSGDEKLPGNFPEGSRLPESR